MRKSEGKKPAPTAAIIDSQAVKASDQGGPHGFDVAKQVSGRKRQLLVDSLGLIWLVQVTAANVQDRDGAQMLLEKIFQWGLGRLRLIWADVDYKAAALFARINTHLPRRGLRLEIVERDPATKGFVVQKRRWVVERTLGWLNKCRRLSKDYEHHTRHSEAMIRVASIGLDDATISAQTCFLNALLARLYPFSGGVGKQFAEVSEEIGRRFSAVGVFF